MPPPRLRKRAYAPPLRSTLAGNLRMNAEPAQIVPAFGWTGGRMLGVDGF